VAPAPRRELKRTPRFTGDRAPTHAACYSSVKMPGHEKRYYTVQEANARVGQLIELFGSVMQMRGLLKTLYQRLETAGFPVQPSELEEGELEPPEHAPEDVRREHGMFCALVESLKEHVADIQGQGCVVKDLEEGLVDWLALHEGREVWLCWKYGEREVGYFHELTAGFTGRRPISELGEEAEAAPPRSRSVH
jgi:hypothetical protein